MEYLTLGLLAFEMSITVQQLTFLTHPVRACGILSTYAKRTLYKNQSVVVHRC